MSLFPLESMCLRDQLPALSSSMDEHAADERDARERPFACVSTLGETIDGRVVGFLRVQVFSSPSERDERVAALLADGWQAWPMDTAEALAAAFPVRSR